jgi:hypothetical protein
VIPDGSKVDPELDEEPSSSGARESAFSALDRFLGHGHTSRHLIVLGGSGMGKTALLLNYFARLPWRRRKHAELVYLGSSEQAEKQIAAIADPEEKTLFLDAFDEDTLALADHRERLRQLLQLCQPFRRVVLTCRTQFFHESEELPRRADVFQLGPKGLGDLGQIQKLYLCPLDDRKTRRFLRRSIPLRQFGRRRKARQIVRRVPRLACRPMILRHLRDLVEAPGPLDTEYEIYR